MAADDALPLPQLERRPLTAALLPVELDLSTFVRVERNILNLRVGLVVAHANSRDFLITRHFQAALKLLTLVHYAEFLSRDAIWGHWVLEVQLDGANAVVDATGDSMKAAARPGQSNPFLNNLGRVDEGCFLVLVLAVATTIAKAREGAHLDALIDLIERHCRARSVMLADCHHVPLQLIFRQCSRCLDLRMACNVLVLG